MTVYSRQTCRFCRKDGRSDETVKYALRHYAHFECYLKAGRKLADLHPWQVGTFPFLLLKRHGLAEEAERILEADKAKKGRAA